MNLYDQLFETGALKICPSGKPFFYTSGKLGPFYINTHFLFGGEKNAVSLLTMIDKLLLSYIETLPDVLLEKTMQMYETDTVYMKVIDSIIDQIKGSVDISKIGYISAGERRDWFFSFPVANILNKTHLTIYKDKTILPEINDFNGDVIHITDLVTEASSFYNTWIPALKEKGKDISAVYSVVDRKQGGEAYFKRINTGFYSLICIDPDFFKYAYDNSYIEKSQLDMIIRYIASPDECMKEFLLENKTFILNAFREGGKTADKARLLVEKNIYDLPKSFLDGTDV